MANLFSEFLKPFTSGLAAPAPNTQNPASPFFNPPKPMSAAPAANQSTPTGARYVAPPTVGAQPAAAVPAAPAATPSAPAGSPMVLPNGSNVTVDQRGYVTSAPSSFAIDTSKPISSDALASTITTTDVQNNYGRYVQQLADAYKPTKDYLEALAAVQSVKAKDAELESNLITGNNLPGDTLDYAQGRTAKAKGLNAIEGLRAEQALQVQELIRSGNIEAAKATVEAMNKTPYSATASPFGGYLIFDQRTGQYSIAGSEDIMGGGGVPGAGGAPTIPTFLQPAIGDIAGVTYIDVGKIASNQLPYAQQVSAQTGIPLLSTEDANKVQEAQATYTGAVTLLDTIANSALNVIYAETTGQAIEQAARLEARALLPNSQERLYKDTKKAFLSMLTRAAGEKGVLTDIDVQRIEKALPTFLDTRQIAQQKQAQLRKIFDAQVQGAVSAYLGVNPTQPNTAAGSGQVDMNAYAW